ncbi:MAG: hypothetical protein J6T27_02040 [Alphaproteobacteria bacterium]|nr:hypothetical protein [Alphaproteobacteria bacterium]
MATKKDFEAGTKKVKSSVEPLEQLKNEGLKRVLTKEELTAVKWWAAILASNSESYESGVRELVVAGNIDNILQSFKAHGNDTAWSQMKKQRNKSQMEAMKHRVCMKNLGKPGRL